MLCLLGALGVLGNGLADNPQIGVSSFKSSKGVGREYIIWPLLLRERGAEIGVDIWWLTWRGRGGINLLFLLLCPIKSMPGYDTNLHSQTHFCHVNLQIPYRANVMNHCSLLLLLRSWTPSFCLAPLQRGQFKRPLKATAHQTGCKKFDGQRHLDAMSSHTAGCSVGLPAQGAVQPFLSVLTYFVSNVLCFPVLFSTKPVAWQPRDSGLSHPTGKHKPTGAGLPARSQSTSQISIAIRLNPPICKSTFQKAACTAQQG